MPGKKKHIYLLTENANTAIIRPKHSRKALQTEFKLASTKQNLLPAFPDFSSQSGPLSSLSDSNKLETVGREGNHMVGMERNNFL
jgi:hypothetical protein